MSEQEEAPEWVVKDVLPALGGPVRSVQMLHDKAVIVLGTQAAVVAEKGALSGVKVYRVDYPTGFLVNGATCPHCHQAVREPVAKIARLAAPNGAEETFEPLDAPTKKTKGSKKKTPSRKPAKAASGASKKAKKKSGR